MTQVATRAQPQGRSEGWLPVCAFAAVQPERGVAALVGRLQLAIFRTFDDQLYALDNEDRLTGAQVLSRGIVGTRGEVPTVASPMLKQVFDLRTGVCLDDPALSVDTYPVRTVDGLIEVQVR